MKALTALIPLLGACASADTPTLQVSLRDAGLFDDPPLRADPGTGIETRDTWKIDEELIARVRAFKSTPEFPGRVAVVKIPDRFGGYRPEAPTEKEMRPFAEALAKEIFQRIGGIHERMDGAVGPARQRPALAPNGKLALFAAFDILTGHVVQRCGPTREAGMRQGGNQTPPRSGLEPIPKSFPGRLDLRHGSLGLSLR
jgi:hypothetical protein